MRILLTGFVPFGRWSLNPSQLVVEALARQHHDDPCLAAEILPTEYAAAGRRIKELIAEKRPEAVLCLGLAGSADTLRLERVALNLDDAELPDNAGLVRDGRLIVGDGPAAYWSTLPLDDMCAALRAREIPVRYSNSAGGFICNHVFYLARHEIEQAGLATRAGFVHLPDIAAPDRAGLPLETMIDAVEILLSVIRTTERRDEEAGATEMQYEQ